MRTFREMESVVEQYNRDLAEWEYQVSRKPTAAANEKRRPPEKQSVLKHLREIQERNKQKPPQDGVRNPLTEIADSIEKRRYGVTIAAAYIIIY